MKAVEFHELAEKQLSPKVKSKVLTTYEQIVQIGELKGKLEGELKERKSRIRRALLRGWAVDEIADFMDLSIEDTQNLIAVIKKEDGEQQAVDNLRADAEVIDNQDINSASASDTK